ncbi:histamine N-methyltransferase-like [Saccoglossus kowalevskii]|uniref:Histamine N-methyltransferase-like n=1 Tax=Saccoglossus kowalevskii TaxID=10224 RepID=A0ABM0MP89_SACKO|nr:PREDICTED: histamine N-methyltransferase-like [Saccoglossus kowalevskii]
MSMKSLYNNHERYMESFHEFLRLSDEHNVMVNWIEGSRGIPDVLRRLPKAGEAIKVLGVGSGSGEMDERILTQLLKNYSEICCRVVEPSFKQLSQYKTLIKSNHQLSEVKFEWRQQTSSEYMSTVGTEAIKFDLVHLIQMLYYVPDIESTIMDFYRHHLAANGVMIIIHVSGLGAWGQLWQKFGRQLPQNDHCNYATGKTIKDILDKNKLNYEKIELPSYFQIDDCFRETSNVGSLLVDFITEVEYFMETAPRDLKVNIMQELRSDKCSYKNNKKIYFKNDLVAFVIQKPTC